MAYVRRTQQLVESVRNTVDRMRQSEVNKIHKNSEIEIDTPLHQEVRKAVEVELWQEAPELLNKIPDQWCKHEDVYTVRFRNAGETSSVSYVFETSKDNKLKMPPSKIALIPLRLESLL